MWGRTATELAAGLRAREFSAREVMASYLQRIEAVNPRIVSDRFLARLFDVLEWPRRDRGAPPEAVAA